MTEQSSSTRSRFWKVIRGRRFSLGLACCLIVVTSALFWHRRQYKDTSQFSPQIIARSRLSDGDLVRLQHVLAKARRGEPVTVGVIGGSITVGQAASAPDRSYPSLVTRWWMDQFPQCKITLVNAGVAGTGSNYGCIRVNRDLISKHPDFVVVEFGVNDRDDLAHVETYEGVIRQLLMDPDQPAIVLLFMMHHDGTSAQTFQSQVGRQYGLPMISYRDAIWPEVAAGRAKFSDFSADVIHPNDRGHAAIATFINSFLQDAMDHLPADSAIPPISTALPPPKFTDLFSHAQILKSADLKPTFTDAWFYDPTTKSWRSNEPGSSIEFDVPCDVVDLLYTKLAGGFGEAKVTVDGGQPLVFDSWLNGNWGPLCQMDQIVRAPGMHHVRIEVLSDKNPLSTGNDFEIQGFGVAAAVK